MKVIELLRLTVDVSKRRLLSLGYTRAEFEARYREALEVKSGIDGLGRLLLVDDVCTHGSTLTCATQRILVEYPSCGVIAATAGQMILKTVVRHEPQLTSTVFS